MNGVAYVDGHREQTVDFDYDEIDERLAAGGNPSATPQKTELVAAAKLLHHIVIIGGTNPKETMLWINVFLFVMGIHPCQAEPGEKVAQSLKVSKDEWFRRVSRMRRILGERGLHLPRIAGQWRAHGQRSVANAAIRSWEKRGGQPMLRIPEAEKKLNWIADHISKLDFEQLPPLARHELKKKLLPVLKAYQKL